MKRRQVFKRGVGAVVVTNTLAGCSGDGETEDDTGGTDGDAEGDEPTERPAEPSEVGERGMQRLFTNNVDTVEIFAVEEVEVTESEVVVDVTLRNTADESVPLHSYALRVHLFETEEPTGFNEEGMIDYTGTTYEFDTDEQEPTPPGETTTLRIASQRPYNSDAIIQSYEVYVDCSRMNDDLPCEGGA